MQKPERLIGFVEVEDTYYSFEFNEETFMLNLYPPSPEACEKKMFDFFAQMNDTAKYLHERTPHKRIAGVSFGGKAPTGTNFLSNNRLNILFDTQDVETNYNGFISYHVNWYFLYSEKIQEHGISGFRLSGSIIDYFYNPEVALQRKVEPAESRTGAINFSVSSNDMYCSADCGEYPLTNDITAKMNVDAYPTMHFQTSANPIDAKSVFITMFSRPLKVEDREINILIKAREYSRLFFHYISYRRNIGLYDAEVCFTNENNQIDFTGY